MKMLVINYMLLSRLSGVSLCSLLTDKASVAKDAVLVQGSCYLLLLQEVLRVYPSDLRGL